MQFIDLKKQYSSYKDEIDSAIHRVLDHGKYIMGDEIATLEKALADYVGVQHCISVASGTDSLLMSLMALDIGPGDEVITIPFTWISTAEVIKLVGAKPVFVDIDPNTYLMDLDQLQKAITPKTKAIIPVDLFGQLPDYDAINTIAAKHDIAVIQDAAQSFGATQNGRRSCSQALLSSTSFFPAKPFGCYGDGGALFTDDDELALRLRTIRTHGGEKRHYHTCVGLNGRLDTIQAAVLLAKLPHFASEVNARHTAGSRYTEKLAECCVTPQLVDGNTHVYAQYTIRCEGRDQLKSALAEKKIPTAVYYPKCLHEQPVFADLGYCWGDFPHSEKASREVLSLPMHPWLTEDEQDFVVDQIKEHMLVKTG